jgi:hypothetical protein
MKSLQDITEKSTSLEVFLQGNNELEFPQKFVFYVRHSRGGGNPCYSYRQAIIQVLSFGITFFNQLELPYPLPFLYLLFSRKS